MLRSSSTVLRLLWKVPISISVLFKAIIRFAAQSHLGHYLPEKVQGRAKRDDGDAPDNAEGVDYLHPVEPSQCEGPHGVYRVGYRVEIRNVLHPGRHQRSRNKGRTHE